MRRGGETDAMKQVQELASRAALIASGKEAVRQASAALGKKAPVVQKASQALLKILIKHRFSVNQAAIDTHKLLQQWNPAIAVDTPGAIRVAYYRAIRLKS